MRGFRVERLKCYFLSFFSFIEVTAGLNQESLFCYILAFVFEIKTIACSHFASWKVYAVALVLCVEKECKHQLNRLT